ncbi:MAG: DUF1269 domain-containing protein [Candidatus Promineofilum sp.]|nr:DUF1269 domain-containing protein [Promineifilum sp.]
MSTIVAITFAGSHEAERVRHALSEVEHQGQLNLDDSAVVVKDDHGRIQVHNEVDTGVKVGALGGGMLGLLIGFIFGGPIGSMLVGLVGGALMGSLAQMGVDKGFMKDVEEAMPPNSSALFFLLRDDEPDAAIAALEPYQGTVYHTSLSIEDEEALRQALLR